MFGVASTLAIKRFHPDAQLPQRQTQGSVGYDLHSVENVSIEPRGRALIDTGIGIKLPSFTYGRVAPRSGMSVKGTDVGAGIIDQDYTSCIKVLLFNHTDKPFEVKVGERIAQLIIERIDLPQVVEVDDLGDTQRGGGGFGSTGAF